MDDDAYGYYRNVLGSPRYFAAPMVKQSDLAFRLMVRRWGIDCCYTPMLKATKFLHGDELEMAEFSTVTGRADRPLVVQLGGREPEQLVSIACLLQTLAPGGFDALDLNLGCPQPCAEYEGYGAFLIQSEEKIQVACNCIRALSSCDDIKVPIFCKIRILPTQNATVKLARRLRDAGCSLLTVHGRVRAAGSKGPVDYETIAAIKAALDIPVVANGGINSRQEADDIIERTGCDGIMVATALLINPRLFAQHQFGAEVHTVSHAISVANEYLSFAEKHLPKRAIVLQKHFWYFFRNVLVRTKDKDDVMTTVRGERISMSLLGTERHKFYTFMNQSFLCSVCQFRELLRLMAEKLEVESDVKAAVTRASGIQDGPVLSMAEIRHLCPQGCSIHQSNHHGQVVMVSGHEYVRTHTQPLEEDETEMAISWDD